MKMASLAKLEANARNVARMLSVLANKERVRCAVSQKTEGAGGAGGNRAYQILNA